MRIVTRDIAGAFIFSADGKVLLGHNRKGGVYEDRLVVPGGGIEDGETKEAAVKRETLEETGIDISDATIRQIEGESVGESEKVLRDTGERVLVKMRFYDFEVHLKNNSDSVNLKFEDDYVDAQWYGSEELDNMSIGPATLSTLKKIHFF